MRLTEEQSLVVEENHNLIYGYAHRRGLDVEEWYGDLAVVLCEVVITHDPAKSALSTLFYNASDNMLNSSYRATNAAKRQPMDLLSLDYDYADDEGSFTLMDVIIPTGQESLDDILFTKDKYKHIFEGPYGEIVEMRSDGYTQEAIASTLGYSQQYVSEILREIREGIVDDV